MSSFSGHKRLCWLLANAMDTNTASSTDAHAAMTTRVYAAAANATLSGMTASTRENARREETGVFHPKDWRGCITQNA